MRLHMSKRISSWMILVVALVAMALFTLLWALYDLPALDYVINPEWGIGGKPTGELNFIFFIVKSVITSLNAVILVFLLITYVGIYRETKMKFSLGLVVFTLSWLIHALIANPMIFKRAAKVLGYPIITEQIFALIALITLLYITYKY